MRLSTRCGTCDLISPAHTWDCPCYEGDDPPIGACWCGTYGPPGGIHVAKPSADEPPEECGTFR